MLRTERPGDMLPVYELVSAAFGRTDEAELVNRLRECGAAVVTQVEEEDYEFMGHLLLSPVTINGLEGPWLGLAPVAVHPDWQGQGIGSELIREGLDTALEMDWKAVVVLGDPSYYSRFGFRPASEFGLCCCYEVPSEHFMAMELQAGGLAGLHGEVLYHPLFDEQPEE
ncbi:GNAT family N-acetyltransferase [Aeromonas molluscorum]|jgi:putative acetyltransferase|uniref:Acetyltransferase n=1 Tax=Aeromonas molluscorum 848 TaxID=1268236 RepID=R1H1H5_9GAMM|nr:N-acetyltransferase [Aeromonas molluscorum]EOD54466.1 acetyltransferase [Aeromonas molluscorum 848]